MITAHNISNTKRHHRIKYKIRIRFFFFSFSFLLLPFMLFHVPLISHPHSKQAAPTTDSSLRHRHHHCHLCLSLQPPPPELSLTTTVVINSSQPFNFRLDLDLHRRDIITTTRLRYDEGETDTRVDGGDRKSLAMTKSEGRGERVSAERVVVAVYCNEDCGG